MNPETNKIEVHYIKSSDFRTIFGNGVFGGITPLGQLNINFFSERAAIPKRVVYAAGKLENPLELTEIEREGKDGIVREVQFGILMDMNMAISFRNWLDSKIEEYKSKVPPVINP